MGMPISIAVVLGSLVCTLGFAAAVAWLESSYCGMPEAALEAGHMQQLGARQRASGPSAQAETVSRQVDEVANHLGSAVPDQGLEGRQRFMTQQLAPVAAYARTRPMPFLTNPNWRLLSPGSPDGMGYNWIWGRGDRAQSSAAGASVMDQMLIAFASKQVLQASNIGQPRRDIFYGPTFGAWTNALMAIGEVGSTEFNGSLGTRLNFGTSCNATDAINVSIDVPLPPVQGGSTDALSCVPLVHKTGGALNAWGALSLAKDGMSRVWGRLDFGRQSDIAVTRMAPDFDAAATSYAQQQKPLHAWYHGARRAWFGVTAKEPAFFCQPALCLTGFQPGDAIELSILRRQGVLVALGSLGAVWRTWPQGWLHSALNAVSLYGGAAGLGHKTSVLTLNHDTLAVNITLTQHGHWSQRGFATLPGAIGYDRGCRTIDTRKLKATLPLGADQDGMRADLLGLYRAVEGTRDVGQQEQAFAQICQRYQAHFDVETLRGEVVSQDVSVPINLFASELWSRILPEGFAMESGLRAQSGLLEHRFTTAAPNLPQPAAARSEKQAQTVAGAVVAEARGFTAHHDHVRTLGPEGKRMCSVQGQVALNAQGLPSITLVNKWSMDRANSSEVGAFILSPLRQLIGTPEGPLWGAGWRTTRDVTLCGAFDLDQLCMLSGVGNKEGEDPLVDVGNRPLHNFVVSVRNALEQARVGGSWAVQSTGVDPLRTLAQGLDTYARTAHLWALVHLHDALADAQPKHGLYVDTDSKAYSEPGRIVRRLHLTRFKDAQSRRAACGRALRQIGSCRALLASDPLISTGKRQTRITEFSRAEAWVERIAAAA